MTGFSAKQGLWHYRRVKPALLLLVSAALSLPAFAQVKITPGPEKIRVEINGKPFTDFYVAGKLPPYEWPAGKGKMVDAEVMKPFLFPLRAASGTYITRMWPMEDVSEEKDLKRDHPHQRGLWFVHDKVNGLDFWNNEAGYTTPHRGKVVLKKLGQMRSGSKQGSIAATFDWQDLQGATQLTESRLMTFRADPSLRIIDLDITLTAAGKVVFGDSKDGAFGIRLRPGLQEDTGSGHITNAAGGTTEKVVWGKPSDWCDYSGDINGERLGVTILDHPSNPHHPPRWHARAYGLFAVNPFGFGAFTNDKSQDGSITVDPGQSLRFRYRVIIHPGDAASAHLADYWKEFTATK